MIRKKRFIILMIVMTILIIYVQWNISSGNPDFYSGKDGGIIRVLEAILFSGSTFYLVMSNSRRILFLLLGLIVSFFSSVVIYLILAYTISYLLPDFASVYENAFFHIISCLAIVSLFFPIEKLINKTSTSKNEI